MREQSASAATDPQVVIEPIPRAAILTAWWNSWSCGQCSADDLLDAMAAFGSHVVVTAEGTHEPLALGLAALRPAGSAVGISVRAVLPVAGDPAGLPGPPALNQLAVAAGQAVIFDAARVALLPEREADITLWRVLPTDPDHVTAQPIRPEQAATAVREALHEATTALSSMDLTGSRDQITASLQQLDRQLRKLQLPASLSPDRAHTAHTAARVLGIVAIAAAEDSSSLTAAARSERAAVLRELARTARRALAAAVSSG